LDDRLAARPLALDTRFAFAGVEFIAFKRKGEPVKIASRRLFCIAAMVALSFSGGTAAGEPNPIPLGAHAFGTGYAELTASWLEWSLAIPTSSNPLLDPDGAFAALGQSGKVWFLAGTVGGTATRNVTIPTGTALFFPIVNYLWVNTPEYGDAPWSAAQDTNVRGILAANMDTAYGLTLEIDGRTTANVNALRVSGEVGDCTLPDDNIFGVPFDPVPHKCVADGYWALLAPLSAGSHTVHFAGNVAALLFWLDVTYHITVRGH